MAGNFRTRPVEGDPWLPSAERDRYLLAAADIVHGRRSKSGAPVIPRERWAGSIVLVRNTTGDGVDANQPLSLGAATIDPSEETGEDRFRDGVVFDAEAPGDGVLAITLAPIADGEVGPAVIDGVVAAQVTGSGAFAQIVDGGLSGTTSSTQCEVLWRQAGDGPQWAIVRLAGRGGGDCCPPTWVFSAHGRITGGTWAFQVVLNDVPELIECEWDATAAEIKAAIEAHSEYDPETQPYITAHAYGPVNAREVHLRWSDYVEPPVVNSDLLDGDLGAVIRASAFGCGGSGGDDAFDASEILTKIKTVAGDGSGLDADTLDGFEASDFVTDAGFGAAIDAYSASLGALADLTPAADTIGYYTSGSAAASTSLTAFGRSVIGAADAAAGKALLSVDDLVTLSGVADGASNLGTFTGSTIADNQTVKTALQALETATEARLTAASNLSDLTNAATARTNLGLGSAAVESASAFATAGHNHTGVYQPADSVLTDIGSRWTAASASGPASLDFREDTDNGTNRIRVIAPASIASDVTLTLQAVTGTVYSSGGTAVAVTDGGTGLTSCTTGDIFYGSGANTISKLAGATSVLPQFLRSIGNGSSNTGTAFALVPGQCLAYSYVATDQSLVSPSGYTDLTTVQSVTFTLPSSATLLITASAIARHGTVGATLQMAADIDGTDYGYANIAAPVATYRAALYGQQAVGVASGSHTIKLQFYCTSGTGNWEGRMLRVDLAP